MKQKISPTQKALNLWAVILIVWSIYRAKLQLPEWFDEFVAKPLVFVLPVYYYIKNVEKNNFFSALYLRSKTLVSDLILGVALGGVFFLTALLANWFKMKKIILFSQTSGYQTQELLLVVAMALATGISEEILSRGFILKRLYEESKNIYAASFFASVLFFVLHVPILFTNLKLTGNLLLMFMATDLILSLVNSLMFLERKSLVLPILIHAFYNLTIILFI